jgi:hypothetical protein
MEVEEAPRSELIMIEAVDPILYTKSKVSFECQAIKFLFAIPYIYFQLIVSEIDGSEQRRTLMEAGIIIIYPVD